MKLLLAFLLIACVVAQRTPPPTAAPSTPSTPSTPPVAPAPAAIAGQPSNIEANVNLGQSPFAELRERIGNFRQQRQGRNSTDQIQQTLVQFMMGLPIGELIGLTTGMPRNETSGAGASRLFEWAEENEKSILLEMFIHAVAELFGPPSFMDQTLLPHTLLKPDFAPAVVPNMTCLMVQVPPNARVMYWAAKAEETAATPSAPLAPSGAPLPPSGGASMPAASTPAASTTAPLPSMPVGSQQQPIAGASPISASETQALPLAAGSDGSCVVAPVEAIQSGTVVSHDQASSNLKEVTEAMGDLSNAGVVTADAQGMARLYLQTPQQFFVKLWGSSILVVPAHVQYRFNNDEYNDDAFPYIWSDVQTAIISQTQKC